MSDQEHLRRPVEQASQQLRNKIGGGPELQRIRWMTEELRVSDFTQEPRTPYPVSDQLIYQAINELTGQ